VEQIVDDNWQIVKIKIKTGDKSFAAVNILAISCKAIITIFFIFAVFDVSLPR